MSKQSWKPCNMLYPAPAVLVSLADASGRANALTLAWAGTVSSDPVMVTVGIRPERYSHDIIRDTGEFVINLTTAALARATDYCGVKSGRDTDKFAELGLHTAPASKLSRAPLIAECPVNLECKVKSITPLGSHDMFLAEVVAVDVDESLLDEKGRLALEKADLLAYAHGEYFRLGKCLGNFGFSVRKKADAKKPYRKKQFKK